MRREKIELLPSKWHVDLVDGLIILVEPMSIEKYRLN